MATKQLKWQTISTTAYYVDSNIGSDKFGDGTMDKPYRTLGKAATNFSYSGLIICRGLFGDENIIRGKDSSIQIKGDYLGAAILDGSLYGQKHGNSSYAKIDLVYFNNMIIKNTSASDSLYGGIGCSYYSVEGLNSNNCVFINSCFFDNTLGGTTTISNNVIVNPATFGNKYLRLRQEGECKNITFYNVPIWHRTYDLSSLKNNKGYSNCIFSKFPIVVNNEFKSKFNSCLFLSDVKICFFPFDSGDRGENELSYDEHGNYIQCIWSEETHDLTDADWWRDRIVEFVPQGHNNTERTNNLLSQVSEFAALLGITINTPIFTNCVFAKETAEEVFNDVEAYDFTIKFDSHYGGSSEQEYGAMPPALNIPIWVNSNDKRDCWDSNTAEGCIVVLPIDDDEENNKGKICIDHSQPSQVGRIQTKLIHIANKKVLSGIFTHYLYNEFAATGYMHKKQRDFYSDAPIEITDESVSIEKGLYKVAQGNVIFTQGGNTYTTEKGDYIWITEEEATAQLVDSDSAAEIVQINNPNTDECIYVRAFNHFDYRAAHGTLQAGARYYNDSASTIMYNGYEIPSGMDFVAVVGASDWSGSADGYELAIAFDDTRLPAIRNEWVPAQHFGEYWVCKEGGNVVIEDGVALGSGNPEAWNREDHPKNYANNVIIQLGLFVQKYQ